MSANEGVAWARKVVAKGWPRKDTPIVDKVEAYEDLAAAYHVLAAQASDDNDMDRYLSCSELAEHADRLARESQGSDQRW